MKTTLSIILSFIATFTIAQHKETRKIENHQGISAATGIQVTYIKSNRNEVEIEVSKAEILDVIKTDVKSNVLDIRIKSNKSVTNSGTIKVTVYGKADLRKINASSSGSIILNTDLDVPEITIDGSSAGKIQTQKINAKNMTVDISSSSKVEIEQIKTNSLNIKASSAGSVSAKGTTSDINVSASSSAAVNTEHVKAINATANVSSGAKATIFVSEKLNANASSGGKVIYAGNPSQNNVNSSSGGSVSTK